MLARSKRFFLGGILLLQLAIAGLSLPAIASDVEDFFKAAEMDNASEIRSLLQKGLSPNIQEKYRGNTGLITALHEGSMKVFDVLLNAPGIDLEATANNGNNALMIAAYKGNKQAVEMLLAKGAAINRPNWTPLHYAAASGSNDIVVLLLERGADINAASPNNTTPLMMAAGEGYDATVKLLLAKGANATLRNDVNMNATDFALKIDRKDIVESLTYHLAMAREE